LRSACGSSTQRNSCRLLNPPATAASYCPFGSAPRAARVEYITEAEVNHASASVTVTAPGRSAPVNAGSKNHSQKMTKISGMPRISSAQKKSALRGQPLKRQAQQASSMPPGKASAAAPSVISTDSSTPPGSPCAVRPSSR